ncbi:MAG: hypothetical protein AB1497_11690 [Bacillota bacterium]
MKVLVCFHPESKDLNIEFDCGRDPRMVFVKRLTDGIVAEYDADRRLIRLEIAYPEIEMGQAEPEVYQWLCGVKECARIAGLHPSNFIRDHANSPDFPAPIATLASGRIWLLTEVVRYFRQRRLLGEDSLASWLMIYVESNKLSPGTLAAEVGLTYKAVLSLLADRKPFSEVTAAYLSTKYGVPLDPAGALVTRLSALRQLASIGAS